MKTTPSPLDCLRKQKAKIDRSIQEIEGQQRDVENRKLVGKCFRYRNSSGPGPKWWLYTIVTHVDKDGWLHATSFEETPTTDGMISLEMRLRHESYFTLQPGHKEITRERFNKAWADFTLDLTALADVNFIP
jgi:hypothetical protein